MSTSSTEGVVVRLTLGMPPSANRYWRIVAHRLYRSREALEYIEAVGCTLRGVSLPPTPWTVDVCLYMKSWKVGDAHNFSHKVLLDALQASTGVDDQLVYGGTFWRRQSASPVITVRVAGYLDGAEPRDLYPTAPWTAEIDVPPAIHLHRVA